MAPAHPGRASETGSAELFHTTHWSVVLSAGQDTSPQATEALEKLCRTYWYPLYAYIRRKGYTPEQAQDLTQEFFARLLARHDIAHANPNKGQFRSFLLGAMNHHLAYEWRKTQAAKRGGGATIVFLDDPTAEDRYRHEPCCELTPEKVYERRWALTLFDLALSRLQQECGAAGKAQQFEALKRFLSGEPGKGEYALVGAGLQMNAQMVAVTVHRLRQRYRELVREEVAQTVAHPAELEAELRHLFQVLRP